MLAAARGCETWARTVHAPVWVAGTPPAHAYLELCRAWLDEPRVWLLVIGFARLPQVAVPIDVMVWVRIRAGNGQTAWLEERHMHAGAQYVRLLELQIPARSIEVDVACTGPVTQPDAVVTGSLAPIR